MWHHNHHRRRVALLRYYYYTLNSIHIAWISMLKVPLPPPEERRRRRLGCIAG